ncbi:MAG: hypothetical protein IJQ20_03475 [Paludibacteraceae bacterium]|nr:hypothetical protein [Paludibacteraceae bacterium]MBQ6983968.1 hypothetical protein [Paludibacteraceae bacterium]
MKRLLLTLFVLAVSLQLSVICATTYFASPKGSGNGLAYGSPTSFSAGVKLLKNGGDTLYLLGGTYEFSDKFSVNKQGSATKRIVISGYPGEKAILDFHKVAYGTRGLTIHADALYIHIKDLSIAWSGKNNLYCEGSYCLFERLDIYGSADTGCQMKKGGNNIILNVDSHDNFDYQTMSGNTANFGGNADGFADKQFTGAGNHYIGCRAWNNSDDGWDFFQRVSTSQSVIENCVCYQNGAPYYDMRNNPRVTTDKAWFDSKVGTTITDRYGNNVTISLDKYPCQGNGNGFKMGGGYTNHQLLIHHCLAIGNYARGFDQNNNDGTMLIYNCTAYDNYTNYGFTTKYGTVTFHNCISFKSKNTDSYKSKTVAADDHNSWSPNFSVSKSDFRSLDTTQVLGPRQANGDLADGSCLRLVSGSALIDAGVNVGLAYNGTAPDLGCYETDGDHHDPDPEPQPEPQPEGTHSVAFVTIVGSAEDKPLLTWLKANDSLWIVETDATDPSVDYSSYEAIVLGSKPSSSVAGFTPLKGYNKPMLLLKPFLLKPSVWGWGTAVNTQDLSISVSHPEHPVFHRLTLTDNELALFNTCNTNAVTAISEWTNTAGVETLASPVSMPGASTVAELPAGTNCNGTVLPQKMIMIGVSEYSTAELTEQGKRLIENAILYLLGIDFPTGIEQSFSNQQSIRKYIENGQMYLQCGETVYDITGRRLR